MKADVLLGLQWGDEGKGKVVDMLAPKYDVVARFQGGPNAGHTLEFDGIKHVLHTIPSGIFHKNSINVIGNGVVIDPITLKKELDALKKLGVDTHKNLYVSTRAHLILPTHRLIDAASEGDNRILHELASAFRPMSVRICIPSKWMRDAARYATSIASR